MRKKSIGIASVLVATILASIIAIGTPVFAGTTQEKMEEADDDNLNGIFSSVTLGNYDDAFAVLSTVATKTGAYDNDRNYYAVTSTFPLRLRFYFNEFKEGNSGEQHALYTGTQVISIEPSGGGTTDTSKWPFPGMEGKSQAQLDNMLKNENKIIVQHKFADPMTLFNIGNCDAVTDAQKGILTWHQFMTFEFDANDMLMEFERDDNGYAYYTSDVTMEKIVGKPGDKLKVTSYQWSILEDEMPYWEFYNYPDPINWLDAERATLGDAQGRGVKVVEGYIYIPYTLTYDSNGGGTAPTADEYYTYDDKTVTVLGQGSMAKSDNQFLGWSSARTDVITDVADIPTDLKKAGSTFDITDDMTLYAVWADKDLVINDIKVPIYKRVVQNGEGTLPDMTFNFTFEQKSEWEGVSYVSTATQIGDKSVTIRESDRYTGNDDPYVGNLTGKKLYYGKYDNILSDFNPQTAGTYLYLVKESIPDPALPNVTYTGSEYVLKVEVDSNKEIVNIPTITLYKDSAGKKKTDYTTPPRVFDEKHELIFYNTYGTNGGTIPTGLMTNILPFIIIGGAGVGGLTLYVMYNVKRKRKEKY